MITHEDLIRYLTDDGYVFTYDESIEQEIIEYENSLREEGRNEVITELIETSKHDKLSRKIEWYILYRGIEIGKMLALKDVEKLLDKIAPDKVAEIKCNDGEIRNRPLIDVARVYEILEQMKGES